ncbi:MAG: molybdenum cofactor synthesis domain-containing protein [bacterium]
MNTAKIISVNISEKKGTVKHPVDAIELSSNGIASDAHSGDWSRQVSLLGLESITRYEKEAGRKIAPGEFAENITTGGLELWKSNPLDRFICGEVELEVTQIGKQCHGKSCNIFKEVGSCVMPKEGIFTRVIHQGKLKPGDLLEYHPKMYRILVITLSDRASAGEYEDRSGEKIREMIREFFTARNMNFFIHDSLIPDDRHKLQELLEKAKDELVDLVFTTGGTGIGPRDFTPDVVRPMLDKEIPGIMEMIRIRYGNEKPNALLSRSIAGVMGKSLVFCLPGSVNAVTEYMTEILRSLTHMVWMLHGLDSH